MNRNSLLKIVNPILAVLIVNQAATGLGNELIPRGTYAILHGGGGVVLTAVALLHLILNWNWVRSNFVKRAPPNPMSAAA